MSLTSTGLTLKSLDTIVSEVAGEVRANIGQTLDTSPANPIGQVIGSTAAQTRQAWELAQAVYSAQDIDQAEGDDLTKLCAANGTIRRGASYSTDTIVCNLSAGTYTAGALVVYVTGSPVDRFENVAQVVVGTTGNVSVAMRAQVAGPVRANAGTLTQIANPISGFNAVTSDPLDAVRGALEESDAELRLRYFEELAQRASSTVDAIRADLLNVEGVTSAIVIENESDTTVAGDRPHSVHAYVRGGDDEAVRAALLEAKGAGTDTNGANTGIAHDGQGNPHTIRFDRVTPVDVYCTVVVTALQGLYVGDTVVRDAIVDWADANQGTGLDVIYKRISAIVMALGGVVDFDLRIGTAPSPTGTVNLVITNAQVAEFDTSRTTVTSTLVTGAP